MLTTKQLLDGSRMLATAAKLREEHAKVAPSLFDRTMYARAAEELQVSSDQLARWSRLTADYERDGCPEGHSHLERYSERAISILTQLQPIEAET